MSDRESAHHLIDTELQDTGEVSAETKAAIAEGLDDIGNGRTISLEEYRRTLGL